MTWQTATESGSTEAVAALAQHWSIIARHLHTTETALLSQTLRIFARVGRPQCLQAIAALTPVIARLGGERALQGVVQAIGDTAEWWP